MASSTVSPTTSTVIETVDCLSYDGVRIIAIQRRTKDFVVEAQSQLVAKDGVLEH